MPAFLRGGTVLPTRERPRRAAASTRADPFTLRVAPDAAGAAEGSLYLDAYDGYAHTHGGSRSSPTLTLALALTLALTLTLTLTGSRRIRFAFAAHQHGHQHGHQLLVAPEPPAAPELAAPPAEPPPEPAAAMSAVERVALLMHP